MRLALEQACLAQEAGEVPVGAVIIDANGVLLASGFNRTIQDHDPTGHAEVVALRNAAKKNGNYRLPGATLYVTLEPCVMCMGAIMHARLARVVFGGRAPRERPPLGVIGWSNTRSSLSKRHFTRQSA
jgi:tRNA(adenine34) deaminase